MTQHPLNSVLAVSLAAIIFTGPALPRAEAMISPGALARPEIVRDQRTQDLRTIQATLEAKSLSRRLHAIGLSDEEIGSRLAKMSDQELHNFAGKIRAVHPAGDGLVPVMVAVLLVDVIISLVSHA
jgi:hypothetical protein